MTRPRLIFAGTPDFAVPALDALVQAGYPPVAVYTQPDRAAGRGRKVRPGPVKSAALAHGLPVFQPASLRDQASREELAALRPDLMVVVAYGLILPPPVLAIPRRGCVNLHASILPRWRGAAPIQRAILAGDRESGVSLMQMDEGLDTGPVLAVDRCALANDETGGSLHDKLARLGADLLKQQLPALLAGELEAVPQPRSGVLHAHKLSKAEARIDWSWPAVDIERLVRAFNPWPVAHTRFAGEVLRIWQARVVPGNTPGTPGTVQRQDGEIVVATGEGGLLLERVQLPGRTPVSGRDLANARELAGQQLT